MDGGKAAFGPMIFIHGLADNQVVVAHTLRLSSALLAAGYVHTVLPLYRGDPHDAAGVVAENLLLLQLEFLRQALGEGQPPVRDPAGRPTSTDSPEVPRGPRQGHSPLGKDQSGRMWSSQVRFG